MAPAHVFESLNPQLRRSDARLISELIQQRHRTLEQASADFQQGLAVAEQLTRARWLADQLPRTRNGFPALAS